MFTNDGIAKTTQLINRTLHSADNSKEVSGRFSGRSVLISHGVNLTYFPIKKDSCKVDCINITELPDHGKVAITLYFGNKTADGWHKLSESYGVSYIHYYDALHLPKIHKKESPLDRHHHVLIEKDKFEGYVQELSEKIGLSSVDVNHIQYLCENPGESRVKFTDGSRAENGGASSLTKSRE